LFELVLCCGWMWKLTAVSATIKLLDDRLVVRLMIVLINQALDDVLFSSNKPLFDGINQAA
jgi:hypothetical protein